MQTEKLLGKWELTAVIQQEYQNDVMVKETDKFSEIKKYFLEDNGEELVNYQVHFSYSSATIIMNGEIVNSVLYSIIDGKLFMGNFGENEIKWDGKNNLTLESKKVYEEVPSIHWINIQKLSRVK